MDLCAENEDLRRRLAEAEAALRDADQLAAAAVESAQARLNAFLVTFADAVRGVLDPKRVAVTACRLIAEELGVDRAYWAEVDWTTREFVVGADYAAPGVQPVGGRFPLDGWEPFSSYHLDGKPVVVNDVAADPRITPEVLQGYQAIGIRADLAVSVWSGNRLRSVLAVNQGAPRAWGPGEIALVRSAAERCWAEIERAQAEAAVRDSEERLRHVLDGMGEGFGLLAPDFTILEHNREALRMDGRAREEIVGRSHWEAFPGSENTELGRRLKQAMAERRPVTLEHRYAWREDRALWLEMRAYPTADGGLAVFWRDVTDRVEALKALRESEARYRFLFEAMDEAYAVVDVLKDDAGRWSDFRFIEVNRAFVKHTSMPWPVGKTATELLGTPNPRWTELYGQALDTGQSIRVEEAEPTLGRTFDLNIFTVDRERNRVAVLFTDITERTRAEAALRESDARHAFLLQLNDALRPLATPDEITEAAARRLGVFVGADRAYYVEWPPGGDYGEVRRDYATPGLPSLAGRYPISVFGSAYARISEGRTWVVEDAAADLSMDPAERQFYLDNGVTAWVDVPLIKGGEVQAALCLVQAAPRRWSRAEIAMAEETAERCWASVERARAEAALRQSQAQLAAAFESVPVGVAIVDTNGVSVISNAEYRRFLPTGVIPSRDPTQRPRWRAWDKDGRPLDPENFPGARAIRGEPVVPGQEMLYTDADGRQIWTTFSSVPLRDASGTVTGVATVVSDVDERKRASEALRASEERFQQFARASSAGLWMRDAETLEMEFVSPALGVIYGVAADTLLGDAPQWAAMIVPEDRDAALAQLDRARAGETAVQEFRIRRPSDGALRWIRNTAFPLYDDGHVGRIGGIAEDVTETRRLMERQRVLLAELQHRVRNTLAMVRSITRRTTQGGDVPEEVAAHLDGRIAALARVQTVLTRSAGAGVDLEDLIREELLAQAADETGISLSGPQVVLSSKAAEILTLAVHELATNATKYGAFAAGGTLKVRWRVEEREPGARWLQLAWEELGVRTLPDHQRRKGFGTELIERRVPYELKGVGQMAFRRGGLTATISFPLAPGDSILSTTDPEDPANGAAQ